MQEKDPLPHVITRAKSIFWGFGFGNRESILHGAVGNAVYKGAKSGFASNAKVIKIAAYGK